MRKLRASAGCCPRCSFCKEMPDDVPSLICVAATPGVPACELSSRPTQTRKISPHISYHKFDSSEVKDNRVDQSQTSTRINQMSKGDFVAMSLNRRFMLLTIVLSSLMSAIRLSDHDARSFLLPYIFSNATPQDQSSSHLLLYLPSRLNLPRAPP